MIAGRDAFLLFLTNVSLVASLAVLPGLIIGYARRNSRARNVAADFSLSKFESIELDRAVLLYQMVCDRLTRIAQECEQAGASLLRRYRHRSRLRKQYAKEREELQGYAVHLRATILRLRRRPLQRCKWWMHVASSQFALSGALLLHATLFDLLIVVFCYSEQFTWVDGLRMYLDTWAVWKPFDDRLLYANWLAAGFVAASMPMLYGLRRAKLRGDRGGQLRRLKKFAETDPDKLIPWARTSEERAEESVEAPAAIADETTWSDVLGVPHSATIEEIRRAYKALIKQSHPDRVHGMSPAFRELAEAETKKLNAAYQEAIGSARHV